MTNTKAYFRAHMRDLLKIFVFILAIVLALTVLATFNLQSREHRYYDGQEYQRGFDTMLGFPVSIMCSLALVLPVIEFSFFKKRIHLDCAYSLPISRKSMGMVHYLSGLITLISAFTLSYLLNFTTLLSAENADFNFVPMLAHFFLCLVLGVAVYSVMVFVFNEANSAGDGVWFMLSYCFVFGLVLWAVAVRINNSYILGSGFASLPLPFGVFAELTDSYTYLVERHGGSVDFWWQIPQYIFWLVFWVVLGIASVLGFYFTFGKRRAEKTGEISDSFFGYRVLIPVGTISCMLIFSLFDSAGWDILIWKAIFELLAIVGYTVYRRGIHFKKNDVIMMIILAVFMFV